MGKATVKVKSRDEITRIVAEIHGVTERYVRMVRNGERYNEAIAASLVEYEVGRTELIKHIESLVPLKPKPQRNGR